MIDADRDPWLDEPLTDEERASIAVTGPLYDLDTLEPVGRATPHGIAAALKAEAPQVSLNRRAKEVLDRDRSDGNTDGRAAYLAAHTLIVKGADRDRQRAARKVTMARRKRRGWR